VLSTFSSAVAGVGAVAEEMIIARDADGGEAGTAAFLAAVVGAVGPVGAGVACVETAEATVAAVVAVAEDSIVARVIVVNMGALPETVALVVRADVGVVRARSALGQVAGVSLLVALVGTLGPVRARISRVVGALSCAVAGVVSGAKEPVVTARPLGKEAGVCTLVAGVRALGSTDARIATVEEASPSALERPTLVTPVAEDTIVTGIPGGRSGTLLSG